MVRASELEPEGREYDSHLELGIFSELSGLRILLLLPNYSVIDSVGSLGR